MREGDSISNMPIDPQKNEPKTMMESYARFNDVLRSLRKCRGVSETLVRKLERTEHMDKTTEGESGEIAPIRNIVQLFNDIANEMEWNINQIGINTEKAINVIE